MELSEEDFCNAVASLPLVSVDFCIQSGSKILLGKRSNSPAKGYWFTPGGRIRKNEKIHEAIKRIFLTEIGQDLLDSTDLVLMGIWDHIYEDSAFSDAIGTHYVNLPHCIAIDNVEELSSLPNGPSHQHSKWRWFELEEAVTSKLVHLNAQEYAMWLLKKNTTIY